MSPIDKLREQVSKGGPLVRLSSTEIGLLKDRHPGLPGSYLQFLTEVGYGDLGEVQLHSGPSTAESIYTVVSEPLKSILIFGDDKQGYCFGFDTIDNFRVVEISPKGEATKPIEPDFLGLLQSYFS